MKFAVKIGKSFQLSLVTSESKPKSSIKKIAAGCLVAAFFGAGAAVAAYTTVSGNYTVAKAIADYSKEVLADAVVLATKK